MGLLDKPQLHLPEDLWMKCPRDCERVVIKPRVSKQILELLITKVPSNKIDAMFLIGSMAGYKYSSTSDVDIQVFLTEDVSEEKVKEYHVLCRDTINDTYLINTTHPINYFISSYQKEYKFKDAAFGVYNMLEDVWESYPREDPENIRDPKEDFISELATAEIFRRYLDQQISENDVEEITRFENKLHRNREFAYRRGWGAPRRGFRNILYKHIMSNPKYKKILEEARALNRIQKKIEKNK